jgi:hypothetical protein
VTVVVWGTGAGRTACCARAPFVAAAPAARAATARKRSDHFALEHLEFILGKIAIVETNHNRVSPEELPFERRVHVDHAPQAGAQLGRRRGDEDSVARIHPGQRTCR